MAYDVSKTTISILLVLTILVSVLGTFAVLNSVTAPGQVTVIGDSEESGRVSINIREPREVASSAQVSLSMKKREEA
ncbi:MAG: hypothetical protein ABIC95_00425 [archaeon]